MLLALASCHNGDWHFDDYGTRSVYFAYQYPVRTITLGEDPSTDNTLDNQHKCKIMATTGGGYTNPDDITVYFEVDETLCDNIVFTGTNNPVKAMPQNYYTLSSNSEMVIPAGKLSGGVEVQLTDDFFNDDIRHAYALVASAAANSSLNKDGMYGFGLAMRRAADMKLSEKENKQFHPRFSRILASDGLRDLLEILRPTLQLIDAKSIPLDYSRLLSDLLRFRDSSKRDRVRIEWAADYLGHDVPDEEEK